MITKRLNWLPYIFTSVLMFVCVQLPISAAEAESKDVQAAKEAVQAPADAPAAAEVKAAPADAPAAEEAPVAPPIKTPKVAIRMLGPEFNIQVLYDHPMDHANNDFIESIQMETPKGDFLGLSTFGPNATEAYAEFMVNPKLADFTEIVLVATSSKGGSVRTPIKLELTEAAEIERPNLKESKNRPAKKPDSPKGGSTKSEGAKEKKFLFF